MPASGYLTIREGINEEKAQDIKSQYRILPGYGVSNEDACQMIKDYFYKDYSGVMNYEKRK